MHCVAAGEAVAVAVHAIKDALELKLCSLTQRQAQRRALGRGAGARGRRRRGRGPGGGHVHALRGELASGGGPRDVRVGVPLEGRALCGTGAR